MSVLIIFYVVFIMAALGLSLYIALLLIKALKIYISKNS